MTNRAPRQLKTERAARYDEYWRSRNRERTAARSRERAQVTLRLLGDAAGRRLLEVGCGPGWALETFQSGGFRVEGVDVSEVAVAEARSRGVAARCVDIESEPLEAPDVEAAREDAVQRADVVVALEVLEHILDPLAVLRKMIAAVAPGGTLVVSLPNEIALPARLQILGGRLPFGGHQDPHIRHFDRRQSRELFGAAGLEITAEVPISVLPPRWALARRVAAPLVRWGPGLFSLATIYRLSPRAGGSA